MTQPQLILPSGGIQFPSGDVINTTLQLGMQNRLINGLFAINQLAVSGSVVLAAGVYGHDGWKAGAGGCTYTFATVGNITTLTISSGTLQQVIEGLFLESGTHCLSWVGTAQGRIDSGSYGSSGITGTAIGGTNQTIEFGTGTLALPQYEPGGNPSLFAYRDNEMQRCLRYYINAPAGTCVYGIANTFFSFQFPTPMRIPPTVIPTVSTGTVSGTIASIFGFYAQNTSISAGAYTASARL